jgi:hypothetical protein
MRNNKDWPIHPSFLIMEKGVTRNDLNYSPNFNGIFLPDELRGFIADASADIKINNILALFQLVPKEFNLFEKDESRELSNKDNRIESFIPEDTFIQEILRGRQIIRIFPGKLYPNIECCSLFRNCSPENKNKCFESDSRIALLYHPEFSKLHYDNQYDEFYRTTVKIINKYNATKNNIDGDNYSLEVVPCVRDANTRKRFYIKYQCQYSKLEEHFFPIIYCGKVIAVLMQGQRFPGKLKKNEMFENDRDKYFKLANSINNLSDEYFEEEPMNDERLQAIIEQVELMEGKIVRRIDSIAHMQIMKKFQKFEDDFRINLKQIDKKKVDSLDQFKQVLNKTLQNIFYAFNSDGFIRIYSIKSRLEDASKTTDEFDLIGHSGCNNDHIYRYSKIILKEIKNINKNLEKNELLPYIKSPSKDFFKDKDILRLNIPFTSQMAYIIWKRYGSWKEDYKDQFSIYGTTLKSMYHSLLEPYIILRGIKLEENLETSMRISVHESAQVIPAVIDAINDKYSLEVFKNGGEFHGNYYINKPARTIIDISYRLKLLEGLFRRSTMVFKNDPPDYEWYDFHRIIYATETLFSQRAIDNNRQRIIPDLKKELHLYDLFTDYAYLSHILFNLVDNAIKYGLRGSNIHIVVNCQYDPVVEKLIKQRIKNITISIINYGDEIPLLERENIFGLYVRYYKENKKIDGMGIGLFLVKKLCDLLGYTIECKRSKKIENYHLPAKYYYTKQNLGFENDTSLTTNIIQHLKKDISENDEKDVVNIFNIKDWEINDLEELIFQPTYRNEFQITIPIKIDSTDNNLKIKKIWE